MEAWADAFYNAVPGVAGVVIYTKNGKVVETRGSETDATDTDVQGITEQESGVSAVYRGVKHFWIKSDEAAYYYNRGGHCLAIYDGPADGYLTLIRSEPKVKPENGLCVYLCNLKERL